MPILYLYSFDPYYRESIDTYYVQIKLLATCDCYSSLLWDREYYDVGSFEVYLPATAGNLEAFSLGRLVGRSDGASEYGIIESVVIEADSENGDTMTVTGRFLPSLLSYRIAYSPIYSSDLLDDKSYGNFLNDVLMRSGCFFRDGERVYDYQSKKGTVSLRSNTRNLPGCGVETTMSDTWQSLLGTKGTIDDEDEESSAGTMQVSYQNIMDWSYQVCKLVGGTIQSTIELVDDSLRLYLIRFSLTEGSDHRNDVIFSDTFQTLSLFAYHEDRTEWYNQALILGEGEGSERKRSQVTSEDTTPTRFDRREIYVDARDLSQEEDTSEEEYLEALCNRGLESLTTPTYACEAQTNVEHSQFVYGVDYDVGDLVSIRHDGLGFVLSPARLVGMIESFDQNGMTLTPTFDYEE